MNTEMSGIRGKRTFEKEVMYDDDDDDDHHHHPVVPRILRRANLSSYYLIGCFRPLHQI